MADYVELDRIAKISRFRSGSGHDFSDSFESCRSMKHYFQPAGGEPGVSHSPSWTTLRIYSPLDGKVVRMFEEWAGAQIWIQSAVAPAFTVRLFHVKPIAGLKEGVTLRAGQLLGTHASDETMSDIAVEQHLPDGRRALVSYFDVMTDAVFSHYRARGVASRDLLIISKAARDAAPLSCSGDRFLSPSRADDWLTLHSPS